LLIFVDKFEVDVRRGLGHLVPQFIFDFVLDDIFSVFFFLLDDFESTGEYGEWSFTDHFVIEFDFWEVPSAGVV
jgi:hypothetical protein